jgi:Rrf2 family protein
MLRVNKKLEYGMIALLYLASRDDRMASVREMSENCHVPEALLRKIMQLLKNANLVEASHGNLGGYRLSRRLSEINLLELTQSLVGPVQVAECLESESHCPVGSHCTLMAPMNLLNQKILQLFQGTSLESLTSTGPRKIAL